MNINTQIARQLQDVYFGGNWTEVSLKDSLEGVAWKEAIMKVHGFNSIAALIYHMNFYVRAATGVIRGEKPDPNDTDSFGHPPIASHADWQHLLDRTWAEVNILAGLVEQMPEQKLWDIYRTEKSGNYFRNLLGITEHVHYHLGQVVLIRKIIRENTQGN
jgi:hypothetical protein